MARMWFLAGEWECWPSTEQADAKEQLPWPPISPRRCAQPVPQAGHSPLPARTPPAAWQTDPQHECQPAAHAQMIQPPPASRAGRAARQLSADLPPAAVPAQLRAQALAARKPAGWEPLAAWHLPAASPASACCQGALLLMRLRAAAAPASQMPAAVAAAAAAAAVAAAARLPLLRCKGAATQREESVPPHPAPPAAAAAAAPQSPGDLLMVSQAAAEWNRPAAKGTQNKVAGKARHQRSSPVASAEHVPC